MDPEIVLGPPGCGKTTTLIGIVEEELARGTPPDRIGYVSFTKRAAAEAVSRACAKFSLDRKEFKWFRTLHSLCYEVLGLKNTDVFEGEKVAEFAGMMGLEITGKLNWNDGTTSGQSLGDRILFIENLARIRRVPLREQYIATNDQISWPLVEQTAESLRLFKKDNGYLDYTDMLSEFLVGDWCPVLDCLLVDEAQDLSLLQWLVVRKLAERAKRVVVAGDDDQGIYRWAGADVDTFINLEGRARVLNQSYRVPQILRETANQIISGIKNRRPKEWANRPEMGTQRRAGFEEIFNLDYRVHDSTLDGDDVLILARNTYLLTAAKERVHARGKLYEMHGNRSIGQGVIEAILDWTALTQDKGIMVDQARNIYTHMKSISSVARGHKTLPRFKDDEVVTGSMLREAGGLLRRPEEPWYEALDAMTTSQIAYVRMLIKGNDGRIPTKPTVRLSTIHGMKGGEADTVVVLTDMANRTWHEGRHVNGRDDEARVWYVATTRAKRALHVVIPRTSQHTWHYHNV